MQRLYAVDALRAFCILIVIGGHFYNPQLQHFGPSDIFLNAIGPLFQNGRLGVTGFFVVSGFLITRLLMQDGARPCLPLREFYVRRLARLFPLLLLIMAFGWLVMYAHLGNTKNTQIMYGRWPEGFTPGFWFSILFFYFNWFSHALPLAVEELFGLHWKVLWSLAVEEQFYLFYPLALRKSFERKKVFVLLGIIAFFGVVFRAWMFMRNPIDHGWQNLTPSAFDPLVLGAGSYLVWEKVREELGQSPLKAFLMTLTGAAITLRVIWMYNERMGNMIFSPLLIGIGCAVFLIGACSLPRRWEAIFKPWAWVGGLSYGLYLLHVTVFCFLAPYLMRIYSYDAGAVLYFSISIGIAWLCYRYYEMPANRWICRCFGVSHAREERFLLAQDQATPIGEAEPE